MRLEEALDNMGQRVGELLKKANALTTGLKKLHAATDAGNLRQIQESLQSARELAETVYHQLEDRSVLWNIDDTAYLSSPEFRAEVVAAASKQALDLIELEGELLAVPLIVRVLPKERAIRINHDREIKLRPSLLAAKLKALQAQHGPFIAPAFIRLLLTGYKSALGQDPTSARMGKPIPLIHVYKALTPLPGQSAKYSLEVFTFDIYRLNESGIRALDHPNVKLDLGGGRPPWLEILTPQGKKRFGTVSFMDAR